MSNSDTVYPRDEATFYAHNILKNHFHNYRFSLPPQIIPFFNYSRGDDPTIEIPQDDDDLAQAPEPLWMSPSTTFRTSDPNDPVLLGVNDPIIPVNPNIKVAIIGAGIGGMYAGLILKSLGIPFEILEMENRVGGRLKTHYFSPTENDYFVSTRHRNLCDPQANINLERRSHTFPQDTYDEARIRPLSLSGHDGGEWKIVPLSYRQP